MMVEDQVQKEMSGRKKDNPVNEGVGNIINKIKEEQRKPQEKIKLAQTE